MAIRDKMRTNAAPHLQPGETIHAVFSAQTMSQWFALISYWIIVFSNGYRVVVVTDRRILICKAGRFRLTPVNAILRELPRGTRIGPPSGLWYKTEHLGEQLYIARRFFKDIEAADAAIGATGAGGAAVATGSAAATTEGRWAPDPSGRNDQRYWDGTAWTAHVTKAGVQGVDPL